MHANEPHVEQGLYQTHTAQTYRKHTWYAHCEDEHANTIAGRRVEVENAQCMRPFCGRTDSFPIKYRVVRKQSPDKSGSCVGT